MKFLKIGLIGIMVSSPLFGANIKKQKANFSTNYSINMSKDEQVHLKEKGLIVGIEGISDSRCPEDRVCWDGNLWSGAIIFNVSLVDLQTNVGRDLEIYYQDKAVEVAPNLILTNVLRENDEYRLEIEFKE